MPVKQERKGDIIWTHIDWELESVTPRMIDWFWANMDKGFFLWHPTQHKYFYWEIPPAADKFIGAIHIAPQQWSDGKYIKPRLRFDDVTSLREDIADVIVYDHAVVVAATGLADDPKYPKGPGAPVLAYRLHQWEKTDFGVKGLSSAIPMTTQTEEDQGRVWAAHATEECSNWGVFLPALYRLYRVIENPEVSVPVSLKVKREGKKLMYVHTK